MNRRVAALLLLACLVGGCVSDDKPAYVRDGVRYGVTKGVFRGRWWSYFERGSSFLAGQYHAEAARDFQLALEGRATDSWRARTYGLHFVAYFPNRELGIVYYHQNRLNDAEQYLTRSLNQIDTERGHYYLDLVKQKKIAAGALADNKDPDVGIVLPKTGLLTDRELAFQIQTQDDTGVAQVTVNGMAMPQRGSAEHVNLRDALWLKEGTQSITAQATDLAGKKTEKTVEVTVDLTGPTIGVFSPTDPAVTQTATMLLTGAAVDRNGVVQVAVDGQALATAQGEPRVAFSKELPLRDGANRFVLSAKDAAGNETRTAINVFKGNPAAAQTKLWIQHEQHPESLRVAQAGPVSLDLLLGAAPETANEIRLKSPSADHPYRHNRVLCVSGEVVTQTKLAKLTINGEPFQELTGAPKESFNRRIPLDETTLKDGAGKIAVAIHAEETGGAALDKKVDVELRPVQLATKESRMPIAVLAFAGQGVDPAVSALLRTETEAQMVQQDRFRILDRTRLQEVLTEQQLAAALADPNEAINLGKLTPAHLFLVADVFPRDQKGLEIKARAISPETSDVVATLDTFIDDKDNRAAVTKACKALSDQLGKLYPRLSGEVLAIRGADFLLNWTKEDGVREGAYALIVREEAPWVDEKTGEVLQPGEFVEVGRARIQSVLQSGSKAQAVEPKKEDAKLEPGLPAVTM